MSYCIWGMRRSQSAIRSSIPMAVVAPFQLAKLAWIELLNHNNRRRSLGATAKADICTYRSELTLSPALRTLDLTVTNGCNAGQTRLLHLRLLLAQHFLAVAAVFLLRCGLRRGSRRSISPISVNLKPTFHCSLFKQSRSGQG